MNPAYPPGFLSWCALPPFRRPKPCRFCGATIPEATSANYTCTADDCQRKKEAARKAAQRRYQRKYDAKRRSN